MSPVFPTGAGRYQDLYQVLLEAIPSSVLLIARDLRIISVNRNFLEKGRRTEADTLNRRLPEVFPPSILDNVNITRRIQMAFELNESTLGEKIVYRAPGGLMRTYYYRVLPLAWQGVVENAMLLMDDVTEQTRLCEDIRQMERHLAIVVESASEFLLSTNPDGSILSWNKSVEQISGYTTQEVQQQMFYQFCAKEHQADIKRVFSELKRGSSPYAAEWNLVTKSGNTLPVSWTCAGMRDDESQTVGIVLAGRDLTESRKLESELLQAQKLAALGVMAGGIAHELRNPLAICSSAAQFLMEDTIATDFRQECARKIHMGIQRSATIIEDLLKFARPTVTSDLTRLNLIPILQDAIGLVVHQTELHHIELRCQLPSEPVWVRGASSLLQQIVMNLFLNSINAMPGGGLLTLVVEQNSTQVWVHICDTGQGIPKSDINYIFDPFFTRWQDGKGVGLGLSLCYFVAKQHAGSIEVDSAEGQGSTFTLKLPLLALNEP